MTSTRFRTVTVDGFELFYRMPDRPMCLRSCCCMASRRPERLTALIVHNAVCHKDGWVRCGRPGEHSGRTVRSRRRRPTGAMSLGPEVHIVDAGHFALDEAPDLVAEPTGNFLDAKTTRRV